jgi:integrase
MATFKAVVNPYRRADGTYRINIRVTHKRAHRDLSTPIYVTSDQITRSFKIKDQMIIDILEDKIREYRNNANMVGFLADNLDIDHFIELLETKTEKLDFFDFFRSYIKQLKADGRDGTAEMYKSAMSSLYKYNGCRPLYYANITRQYMLGYFESLKHLKPNTQVNYIGQIQAVYKKAQQKYNNPEIGITVVRYGVFDLIEKPQKEAAKDNALKTVEQMQALIDEPYRQSWSAWSYELAKDMFILAFCCFGTNMADFVHMRRDQYKDGILYYRRKKAARQSKERADMQIRVPEPGRAILEKYSGDPEYLINFKGHSRNARFTRYIHYYFAKIGLEELPEKMNSIGTKRGKYTFYANRHSMASFAINVCGIDYMIVHEMLNHASPSNFKTTDAYIWRDYTHLWDANEKLMALFDWSFYLRQADHPDPSCPASEHNTQPTQNQ